MLIKDILRELHLGASVAEHDEALEAYFIETATFRALVADRQDTIAGDKGTGKTALYRILKKRYPTLLKDVEVLAGFNPAGAPVFQRLAEGTPLNEGQYITIWKAYVFSLVGNWVLTWNEGGFSHKMEELDALLKKTGLRSADDSASTVFSQLVNLVKRLMNPKSAEMAATITAEGLPVIAPRVEFGDAPEADELVRHDDALRLLNDVLEEVEFSAWVVLDRLDEAFQGFPEAEVPVLRALLRTYLDLAEFPRITLKLFVRKDLFRRIIEGGFVNLTHVNARKVEIVWDQEDLYDLLCRRFRENREFVEALGLPPHASNDELFNAVFPRQVDQGSRKPTTWNWMLSRIRDGNGIAPPRNLIDLVTKAQEAQMRKEERAATEYVPGGERGLIDSDSLKRGLAALSTERVEDTLLAEAGESAVEIEGFRGGRAEHNNASIAEILAVPVEEARSAAKPLVEIGFLEQTGETFKVPMLYRGGLSITQGKAFAPDEPPSEDDET
ncbi:MAG: P-loop ATPase, Sll1717 family [Thermoleophilaceae bacterium]